MRWGGLYHEFFSVGKQTLGKKLSYNLKVYGDQRTTQDIARRIKLLERIGAGRTGGSRDNEFQNRRTHLRSKALKQNRYQGANMGFHIKKEKHNLRKGDPGINQAAWRIPSPA